MNANERLQAMEKHVQDLAMKLDASIMAGGGVQQVVAAHVGQAALPSKTIQPTASAPGTHDVSHEAGAELQGQGVGDGLRGGHEGTSGGRDEGRGRMVAGVTSPGLAGSVSPRLVAQAGEEGVGTCGLHPYHILRRAWVRVTCISCNHL